MVLFINVSLACGLSKIHEKQVHEKSLDDKTVGIWINWGMVMS